MPSVDVGPNLPGAFKDIIINGIRQNAFTSPLNMPWTGNNGTSSNNAYRIGRITAPADPASNGAGAINRFFFHYNAQSVSLSSSADPSVRPTSDMAAPKVFSDITATETMSFDFLLNRMPDVALPNAPNVNASARAYGTLHDLYYLYGLINRNFADSTIKDFDYPNTDTGLLLPYPVVVIFGELFRFTGQVIGLAVQHAKFIASPLSTPTSAPLIPVLTTVSLSLKRVVNFDQNSADPSGGIDASTMAAQPGVKPTTGKPDLASGMQPIGEVPNQSYYTYNSSQTLTGPDSSNQGKTVLPTDTSGGFDPRTANTGGG